MTKNEDKNKNHSPLLYIDQPAFHCEKPSMQQVYQTSQTKEREKEAKKSAQKKKPKRNFSMTPLGYLEEEAKQMIIDKAAGKNSPPDEKREEVKESAESKVKLSPTERFKPVKAFKDMNVDERLEYLVPFIGNQAPFYSQFVFQDQTHVRGILKKVEDNELVISSTNGEIVERNKNELVNIFIS
ncbi:CotO family spore coat protein [Jeotgalibacillus proteolyticus]|uniref:Spore coat protein CotO n=1 Tax=Jeotgalibacillus proteolyticus TaxID=2082395 RepID=A0A2S5GHI0_9BACL|nr:CotO family spore coat protein [Jeotgalibacillus proteolyticus]PPA72313.1 hypothetical protein C4B60_02755 [Jeotgalibacillus proteolyticus]